MANYVGMFLSNEFKVTDEQRLRDIISRIETNFGEGVEVFKNPQNGLFSFGSYDDICGYVTDEILEEVESGEIEKDDGDYCDMCNDASDVWLADIGAILPSDEACIVVFAGHEKMRYETAYAAVITHDDVKYVDLWSTASDLARKMLGNKDKRNFHLSN